MYVIRTNFHARDVLEGWQLTEAERAEFDYVNWPAIDADEDSASFFRYRGDLYDLSEFSRDWGATEGTGLPEPLRHWDGFMASSMSTGMLVRWAKDDAGHTDSSGIVVASFYVKDDE